MEKEKTLDFIKKNKIGIVVLIVVIFLFYFFAIRPGMIRQNCYNLAHDDTSDYYESYGGC